MKTWTWMIAIGSLVWMTSTASSARPMIEAGSVALHPAQLSLPGEVVGQQMLALQCTPKSAVPVVKVDRRLHPAQLSLEGEVIEDVLAPAGVPAPASHHESHR